jgi:hypothetical protein
MAGRRSGAPAAVHGPALARAAVAPGEFGEIPFAFVAVQALPGSDALGPVILKVDVPAGLTVRASGLFVAIVASLDIDACITLNIRI